MSYNLHVNSNFWTKDSNLLFDYDSGDYFKSSLKISKSGFIFRKDKSLAFTDKNKFNENSVQIARYNINNDIYGLEIENNIEVPSDDDIPWIIIRFTNFTNKNGYRLKVGNIIRFGKSIFRITEINNKEEKNYIKFRDRTLGEPREEQADQQHVEYSDNGNNHTDLGQSNSNVNFIQISKMEKKEILVNTKDNTHDLGLLKKHIPICRICWCSDHEADNPLLKPCHCSGSVKYIHLVCLQQSLKSKITTKVYNFHMIHAFKPFECELCKKPLPDRIEVKNQIFTLVDLHKPENNYIILETITKDKSETKYIFTIHMKDKYTIRIGRSNESDVRMSDIAISRNHALIKSIGGHFYLDDNNSKFGTLVQSDYKIVIIPYKQLSIQMGRYFYSFNLKRTLLSCLSCYRPSNTFIIDYNQYFDNNSYMIKRQEDNTALEKISKYESDKEYSIYSEEEAGKFSKKISIPDENQIKQDEEKVDEIYHYGSFREAQDKRMKSLDISEIHKDISELSLPIDDLKVKKSLSYRENQKV